MCPGPSSLRPFGGLRPDHEPLCRRGQIPCFSLRAANFVDFLVPYATEIPNIEVLHLETPSPLNPLGVKGVGEAGCIAVGAVVASAVEEALKPLGAGKFHHVPLTPSMIQAALDHAGA